MSTLLARCLLCTILISLFSCNQQPPPPKNTTIASENPPPEFSHFEHLKDLSWLVGNWIDADDNVDIELSYQWDKNKNFLTQKFVMQTEGEEELQGFQIIGWDPIKEAIRSWIFDSDGGFGESTVTQDEDGQWISDLSFTLADGRKASATMIYKKIDDNTYTFSSEGRDIDGEVLPNIGPVKVVRKR